MAAYLLYGSKMFLAEAKEILEELLTLQFESRESDYQGGEYFHAGSLRGEDFVLKRNVDPFDGDPVEMMFPEFPIILYINATSRSEELTKSMAPAGSDFVLLRNEDF